MTGLETCLRNHMGVPEEDMQTLLSFFKPTTLEKGDFYLKKGRICDNLSFHRSGLMRVFAPYQDKEVTQWIERALVLHCFSFMETRVFSLLSMSADERYQYLQDQNPDLFQQVPLKYLASMMGMTPESLSRIRRRSLQA